MGTTRAERECTVGRGGGGGRERISRIKGPLTDRQNNLPVATRPPRIITPQVKTANPIEGGPVLSRPSKFSGTARCVASVVSGLRHRPDAQPTARDTSYRGTLVPRSFQLPLRCIGSRAHTAACH